MYDKTLLYLIQGKLILLADATINLRKSFSPMGNKLIYNKIGEAYHALNKAFSEIDGLIMKSKKVVSKASDTGGALGTMPEEGRGDAGKYAEKFKTIGRTE